MEKILYKDFLNLPKSHRGSHSIAHEWEDEHGDKWVAVFLWAKAERFFKDEDLPDDLYLQFYNLNISNDDDCLDFIENYYITHVGEHKFDDSGAFKYTIDDLRFDHEDYQYDLDLLAKGAEEVHERLIEEQKVDGGSGETAFWSFNRINENLKRCSPTLKIKTKEKHGHYYYQNFKCDDFLSLCYWQIFNAVINHEAEFKYCVDCGKIYQSSRENQKYCSKKCQKHAANKRQWEKTKADPEKHEKYKKERREYMRKYR